MASENHSPPQQKQETGAVEEDQVQITPASPLMAVTSRQGQHKKDSEQKKERIQTECIELDADFQTDRFNIIMDCDTSPGNLSRRDTERIKGNCRDYSGVVQDAFMYKNEHCNIDFSTVSIGFRKGEVRIQFPNEHYYIKHQQ